ncbi:serine carboxypeptidase-like 9 [Triticum dicoccoides]|uniref:serine carboxypeptidase-like 9 n=1 Tax=Triticum dicoccoides TaxID=85692 RepID=UPI00188EF791|nr:serine carboxypeptidase-like 9 [Triticum dicoccoides]
MATRLPHRWMLVLLLFQLRLLQPCLAATPPVITTNAVTSLPGFSGPLPFSLETGYVELDDDGIRFFYYFIQSERSPEDDPVLLWLTGGPGCSALSGLVYEVGPLAFDFHGYRGGLPTLLYRRDSWTQVSNIIFVDSPAGTGFTYDPTDNKLIPSDTIVVRQLHTFLETWFDEHPMFLSNPLYIAGDSYSGMIIPSLTIEIAKGIESGDQRLCNLKGYIAGNPLTELARFDGNSKFPYLQRMGFIPDELYKVAFESCGGKYNSPLNALCAKSVQSIHNLIKDLNAMHILEPPCDTYPSLIIRKAASKDRRKRLLQSPVSSICRNATYVLADLWANDEAVRESLGIHKGTVPSWRRHAHFPYIQDINSTVEYHLSLITKGYRAMVYSGDHDSEISLIGTQAWIRYLNLSITDDWRPWYVDDQVAGYTTTYSGNLTYATVKGAGHTAPEYMPRECLAMIDRWLSGEPL